MSRRTIIALSTAALLGTTAALALAARPERRDVPDVTTADGARRPPRVIIAGGGYVGFCVARSLRAQLNLDQVEIAVIDSRAYMTYQPFLPEVAAGSIQPRHVIASHRRNLDGVTIITGAITAIDHAARTVTVRPPTPQSTREQLKPYTLTYDHLVLALGAEARTLPIPGLAEQAMGFKQVEEATALRNRVLTRIEDAASTWDAERRRRLLTFVFVGGGFAGVEAIAELEDMARATVRTIPSIDQDDVRFVLVEGSRRILPELTEELSGYGLQQLLERGIDVRLSTFLSSCVDGHVVLSDGTEFDADTIVWTAGVKAAPVLQTASDLPIEPRGRVTALPTLQVARDGAPVEGAWAAGDCAAIPDLTSQDPEATCAPTAQHAVRQATVLADNLVAVLTAGAQGGAELRPVRPRQPGHRRLPGHRQGRGPHHGPGPARLRRLDRPPRLPRLRDADPQPQGPHHDGLARRRRLQARPRLIRLDRRARRGLRHRRPARRRPRRAAQGRRERVLTGRQGGAGTGQAGEVGPCRLLQARGPHARQDRGRVLSRGSQVAVREAVVAGGGAHCGGPSLVVLSVTP